MDDPLPSPLSETPSLCIIDDEPNARSALCRLLEGDYTVHTFASAPEALRFFEEGQEEVAVVISDFRMPGGNGLTFLKELGVRAPHVIRILLSGYLDQVSIVDAVNEARIFRIIEKPYNNQEVMEIVASAYSCYMKARPMGTKGDKPLQNLLSQLGPQLFMDSTQQQRISQGARHFLCLNASLVQSDLSTIKSAVELALTVSRTMEPPVASSILVLTLLFGGTLPQEPLERFPPQLLEKYPQRTLLCGALGVPPKSATPATLKEVQEAVRHLTERFDGRGKPLGLSGDKIPLASRIAAAALFFASVRERAQDTNTARELVRWNAGRLFDPTVIKIVLDIAYEDADSKLP